MSSKRLVPLLLLALATCVSVVGPDQVNVEVVVKSIPKGTASVDVELTSGASIIDKYPALSAGDVDVFFANVAPGPIDILTQAFDAGGTVLASADPIHATATRSRQTFVEVLRTGPPPCSGYDSQGFSCRTTLTTLSFPAARLVPLGTTQHPAVLVVASGSPAAARLAIGSGNPLAVTGNVFSAGIVVAPDAMSALVPSVVDQKGTSGLSLVRISQSPPVAALSARARPGEFGFLKDGTAWIVDRSKADGTTRLVVVAPDTMSPLDLGNNPPPNPGDGGTVADGGSTDGGSIDGGTGDGGSPSDSDAGQPGISDGGIPPGIPPGAPPLDTDGGSASDDGGSIADAGASDDGGSIADAGVTPEGDGGTGADGGTADGGVPNPFPCAGPIRGPIALAADSSVAAFESATSRVISLGLRGSCTAAALPDSITGEAGSWSATPDLSFVAVAATSTDGTPDSVTRWAADGQTPTTWSLTSPVDGATAVLPDGTVFASTGDGIYAMDKPAGAPAKVGVLPGNQVSVFDVRQTLDGTPVVYAANQSGSVGIKIAPASAFLVADSAIDWKSRLVGPDGSMLAWETGQPGVFPGAWFFDATPGTVTRLRTGSAGDARVWPRASGIDYVYGSSGELYDARTGNGLAQALTGLSWDACATGLAYIEPSGASAPYLLTGSSSASPIALSAAGATAIACDPSDPGQFWVAFEDGTLARIGLPEGAQ